LYNTEYKLKDDEMVRVGENASAILQTKLLPRFKDPESFTIQFTINNTRFEKSKVDFRAFINVMRYSIYAFFKILVHLKKLV
jgi:hypothetical protein